MKPVGGEKKPMGGQGVVPSIEDAFVTLSYGTTTIGVVNKVTLGLAKKLLEDIEKDMESSEKATKKEQKESK